MDATFTDPADRSAVTGNIMDRGAYRAPSLRNVTVSAPYMHDGRFLTLDGYMMLTQKDEFIYHEMLVHVPMCVHPDVRKVLAGSVHTPP